MKTAFLDRDGTLNAVVANPELGRAESPLDPRAVALIDGAPDAVRRLRDAGFLVVVVSNQPGAAKAETTLAGLRAVHERVAALLAEQDASPDAWRYCLHSPRGTVEHLAGPCPCRKPAPGMLLAASVELGCDLGRGSWMIGDTDADAGAGAAAGCSTILLEHPPSAHRRGDDTPADGRAGSLAEAVDHILSASEAS